MAGRGFDKYELRASLSGRRGCTLKYHGQRHNPLLESLHGAERAATEVKII